LTLVELLVVIAVISIIASLLIPMLLNALQKAKQKRTMAEMHEIGKAMTSFFLDQVSSAAAGANAPPFSVSDYGSPVSAEALAAILVPSYLTDLRPVDGWGWDFEFYLQTDDLNRDDVMAIRSPGDDGAWAGDSYTPGPFKTTDFSEDLVWADGVFVRWPQS